MNCEKTQFFLNTLYIPIRRLFSEIKEKNESFGTSLLLANIGPNSPMSPKIVEGSFAALFDNNDVSMRL